MTDANANTPLEIGDPETARRYFDIAVKAEQEGDRLKAIEAYEAAFTADPDNAEVCFRLAYNLDLVGEEDEALHLYEQAVQRPNPPLNALLNLAVLYEDRGQLGYAERCVRQVLDTNPNHARARLFIKDIEASKAMVLDEDRETLSPRDSALLETPVTDFDLAVRTRNALRRMNIRTLADLLRISEAELRSYKNFGEASIEEIKSMLAQKKLALGQAHDQRAAAAKQEVYEALDGDEGDENLRRSVNELQLPVRARKALALLNIQTIGDLVNKTEAELMGVKNFGVTSLHEIKNKLADMGLSLRRIDG